MRFQKTGLEQGMKLSLALSFLFLNSGSFNLELQYFIPLFNKISLLCGHQPGGDEASNEGCKLTPNRA
jgi:hypothetical protein